LRRGRVRRAGVEPNPPEQPAALLIDWPAPATLHQVRRDRVLLEHTCSDAQELMLVSKGLTWQPGIDELADLLKGVGRSN